MLDVEQARAAAEEGGEGAAHGEVAPGRRVRIEFAGAVPDRDMVSRAPARIAQVGRVRIRPPVPGLGIDPGHGRIEVWTPLLRT